MGETEALERRKAGERQHQPELSEPGAGGESEGAEKAEADGGRAGGELFGKDNSQPGLRERGVGTVTGKAIHRTSGM